MIAESRAGPGANLQGTEFFHCEKKLAEGQHFIVKRPWHESPWGTDGFSLWKGLGRNVRRTGGFSL
jgi:hypothetical protein